MHKNFQRIRKSDSKLSALTVYDYPTARILDSCGLDFLLVGDSLGMVVLGMSDTTEVTIADMIHHTRAVRRGVKLTPIIVDLPFGTYTSPATALETAGRLLEAGADGVKLEGGVAVERQIAGLVANGIPVMGHVGMLPQQIREEGRYRVKGRSPEEAERIRADALAVEQAGAIAVVLELVSPALAAAITTELSIPTIGIGSGSECGGQIRVFHDIVGLSPWFRPKFAIMEADGARLISDAVKAYIQKIGSPSSS